MPYIHIHIYMTKLFLKGNDEHIIKATGFLWEEDRRIKGRRVQKLGSGFIVFFYFVCFEFICNFFVCIKYCIIINVKTFEKTASLLTNSVKFTCHLR